MLWFGLGAGFSGPALPAFVGLCLGWYAFINQGCPCSWPLLYRFLLKDDNLCCPSVSAEIWGISFVNWAERGGTCVLFSDKYHGNWVFFLNRWLRWVQPWGPLGSGLRGQALTCSFPFCSQACTDHWLHKTSFNLCCTKYRWSLIEQTTYLHNSVMMTHSKSFHRGHNETSVINKQQILPLKCDYVGLRREGRMLSDSKIKVREFEKRKERGGHPVSFQG